MPRRRSLLSRLFARAARDSEQASDSGSIGSGSPDEVSSFADASERSPVEVWLHPDTEQLKKQTLMEARRIEGSVFLVGRRTSELVAYPYENPPDLLLFENSPYTLSKLHCQIEITDNKVILHDLGSRSGTVLGKKRLFSKERKPTSMVVPKGSHRLVFGRRDGPFHFRLVVS